MSIPLEYDRRPPARTAPWWLWTLAALSLLAGAFWCLVPLRMPGGGTVSRMSAARSDVVSLSTALDAFRADTGRYPTTTEGLGALLAPPAGVSGWRGPYLRARILQDPWANPYVYAPGAEGPPAVRSLGPDGDPAPRSPRKGAPKGRSSG